MTRLELLTLIDWPDDRLPTCAAENCGREIPNYGQYAIVPNTLVILCQTCAEEMRPGTSETDDGSEPDLEESSVPQVKPTAPKAARRPAGTANRIRRPAVSCTWCGGPVTGRGGRSMDGHPRVNRYCTQAHSHEHRTQLRRQEREARKIPCPTCGRIFIPALHGKREDQKYCSFRCSGERISRLPDIICRGCLQTFKPQRYIQMYCTDLCRYYGNKGKINPRQPVLRWSRKYDRCVVCGTTSRVHLGNGQCSRCYCPPGLIP